MASRVYQRDANGKAEIPIVLDEKVKNAELIDARVDRRQHGGAGDQAGRRQARRRAGRWPVHDQLQGQDGRLRS